MGPGRAGARGPCGGAHRYRSPVPWDDDADDDAARLGPPPPADDRLWRHPSELGAQRLPGLAAGTSGATSTAPRRPASWPLAAAAGVTGALLMFGAIALTGALPERTVEQRVVEKVAMTPVVSSPALDQRGTGALARKVGPAIVRLDVVSGDGARSSVSGVVFRDDGLILTSALPLRGATTITAVLSDGRQLDASVRGLDDATDVAVVDVDADQLEVAVLGSSADLAVGDVVVALGYPLGLRGSASASSGTIQALGRMVKARDGGWLHGLVQADAGIPPGASGGALVDATGAVVGISTSRAVDPDGDDSFAVPAEVARRVADQLIAHGRARHAWLGVEGADLRPGEAQALGVSSGAVIRGVVDGSPAAAAGLQAGDVITDVDGAPVRSMTALVVATRTQVPGQEVTVGYQRDGQSGQAPVVLAERPSEAP